MSSNAAAVPQPTYAAQNEGNSQYLEASGGEGGQIYTHNGNGQRSQRWTVTVNPVAGTGQIRSAQNDLCITAVEEGAPVTLEQCDSSDKKQQWRPSHKGAESVGVEGQFATAGEADSPVTIAARDSDNPHQRWRIES